MKPLTIVIYAVVLSASFVIARADDGPVRPNKNLLPDKAFSTHLIQDQDWHSLDWSPVNGITYETNDVISLKKPFISPDGRFSLTLQIVKYDWWFLIEDRKTGKLSRLRTNSVPLFFLEWSPDSQSFVVVEHLAHTSYLELVHWDGFHWAQFPIYVPAEMDNSHVVNWKFEKGGVKATYLADQVVDNKRSPTRYYLYTFLIDSSTGHISEVKGHPVSADEYAALRTNRN